MSLEEEATMLRNIAMFAHLDASKLKLLAFTSQWMTFKGGEELCHQGDRADSAFIITSGVAEILLESDSGPVSIAERGRNEVIGEMAIFCDIPRTATVRAKGEVSTLQVSKDVFTQLVKGSPEIAVQMIRTLANRLEESTAKLRDAKNKLNEAGIDD